jgi:hypothetical protein
MRSLLMSFQCSVIELKEKKIPFFQNIKTVTLDNIAFQSKFIKMQGKKSVPSDS